MKRRSKLIAQYLRTQDPLGPQDPLGAAAGGREHRAAPRPRVRRVVLGAGIGGLGITAAVAISIAGWLPGGSDALMSPEQAVAAVASDLRSGQIVHWRARQEQTNPPSSPFGRLLVGTIDQWANTRTGASHVSLDFPSLDNNTAFDDDESGRLETWSDGDRTTWTASPAPRNAKNPGRTRVDKIVSPKSLERGSPPTPIDLVRQSLERADEGSAAFSSAGTWRGAPVIKVTTREPQTTSTIWIARTKQPRLLKTVTDSRYPDGSFLSHTVTTTTIWELYPDTDEVARRQVAVPRFDPAKYDVREPLGTR